MMRKVFSDEIYSLQGERIDTFSFLEHIPRRYRTICSLIHHVDTRLREDESNGKYWRIQGYILYEELNKATVDKDLKDDLMYNHYQMYCGFSKDAIEIWSMVIDYKE